jgi:hypothetical protein
MNEACGHVSPLSPDTRPCALGAGHVGDHMNSPHGDQSHVWQNHGPDGEDGRRPVTS